MREGRALFIDDATLIPPTVLAVVYPAMDGRRQIMVKANGGEIVNAADGFYVVAGHNPGVHGAVLTDALVVAVLRADPGVHRLRPRQPAQDRPPRRAGRHRTSPPGTARRDRVGAATAGADRLPTHRRRARPGGGRREPGRDRPRRGPRHRRRRRPRRLRRRRTSPLALGARVTPRPSPTPRHCAGRPPRHPPAAPPSATSPTPDTVMPAHLHRPPASTRPDEATPVTEHPAPTATRRRRVRTPAPTARLDERRRTPTRRPRRPRTRRRRRRWWSARRRPGRVGGPVARADRRGPVHRRPRRPVVTIAPGAGHGAPACLLPAQARIEIDGTHLGRGPGHRRPRPTRPTGTATPPRGACSSTSAPTPATPLWTPTPDAPPAAVGAAMLLEESRIEAAQTRRRPEDRHWLRAAASALILADLTPLRPPGAAPRHRRPLRRAAARAGTRRAGTRRTRCPPRTVTPPGRPPPRPGQPEPDRSARRQRHRRRGRHSTPPLTPEPRARRPPGRPPHRRRRAATLEAAWAATLLLARADAGILDPARSNRSPPPPRPCSAESPARPSCARSGRPRTPSPTTTPSAMIELGAPLVRPPSGSTPTAPRPPRSSPAPATRPQRCRRLGRWVGSRRGGA